MAAVGAVLSIAKTAPLVGMAVITFPAISVPTDNVIVASVEFPGGMA